jgi:regulator of protease activity HflC (stomatin/prohibitin superfamily)
MENLFGWVSKLMEVLGSLIPTWYHLEKVDVGVIIKRGNIIIVLEPGIIWYWPFWSVLYHRAANRQTVNLATQTLTTKDGISVAVGCMVRYIVDDAEKSLVDTNDVDNAIVDETLAVLCEFITSHTLAQIQEDRQKITSHLTREVKKSLRTYGVLVERAQLTDFSRGRCLIHVGLNKETIMNNGSNLQN